MAINLNLTRTFNGIETAELFITPALTGEDVTGLYTVIPNVVSQKQLDFRNKGGKLTRKAGTCSFSPVGTITFTDKVLSVEDLQIHHEICWDEIEDSIYEQEWLKKGTDKTDLTATQVEALMIQFMMEAIKEDTFRNAWWGDASAASANFDFFDGYWRLCLDGSADVGHIFDISTVETASALDTDAGQDTFANLFNNADANLLKMGVNNLRIYATRGLVNNYRATRRASGTDIADTVTVNGMPRLAFEGIPVVEIPEWDTELADADNPVVGEMNTTSNNVAMLTVPQNLLIGTDAVGAARGTDARVWYSLDNQTLRGVINFRMGVQKLHPSLVAIAI